MKKRIKGILVLAVSGVLLCTVLEAQETEKKMSTREKGTEMMPKPAPEMEKWKWMLGKWSVTETHEKSEWSPGGTGKGTMQVSLGPGGHSHVYVYNSTGPMGKFAGRGMTAWDPEKKVYEGTWADNMSPGISTSECVFEGSDLVCTGEGVMGGKKMTMRTRATNPGPGGWTEVAECSIEGGPYQKMMTLQYKRGT